MNHRTRHLFASAHLVVAGLMLLALLVGCSTAPRQQLVQVPLPVECREVEPARPAMPTEALAPGVSLDDFVKAAQAEIERREGYEVELLVALRTCIAPVR